jgi:putative endonuclease
MLSFSDLRLVPKHIATCILARTGRISAQTVPVRPRKLASVSTESRLQRGAAAESIAAEYLQGCGLELLARNLRCKGGELDLVCLDGGVLAVVEVRQRGRADFGGAAGSVTRCKQRKLIRAARFFLQRQPAWRAYAMRFDVLALEGTPGEHRIVWIKDAFRAA